MDSKQHPESFGDHCHGIVMESVEKTAFDHPPRQPEHQRRQKKLASVRIILVTALVLGLVGLGVSAPKSTTLWRIPCHVGVVAEQDPSTMETASAEALQDSLPGRLQPEALEADNDPAGPVATTFQRLRRQDNSTAATPPPPTTSSSTTIPPSSSTTPPPPPPPTTSSTKSSTSSTSSPPPPPPPSSSSTPPPPPPPPTTSTTPPPPPPPSSTPQLTTIPGTSPTPVSNNRVSTSSTPGNGNGNAGAGATPAPSPTPAPNPPPAPNPVPSTINGGTILTRLTTLDRGGGTTVVQVPETIPAQTSQVVVETLTSTRPNGEVVMVTQTSYVPADPAVTGEGYNANEPSLHNGAPGKKGLGGVAVGVMVGVMIGAALV